jgi:serine/threonine protein phosphatase PrpC
MHQQNSAPASLNLRWSGHTDVGRIRKNNEDSFLALQFDAREVRYLGKIGEASTENADFVFAVSDGMGGAKAGEFASRITVDKITHLLPRSFKQAAVGLQTGFEDVMGELFDQIHKALAHFARSYTECAGMGATLSLCWFSPGWMHFGHIGDSRIYYLPKEGGMKQVTHDDTYVGWLFRKGEINERQAREHPRRTVLQRALGAGNQFVEPQVGAVGFEPGDRFLLCTDGLVDGFYDQQLAELAREPEKAGSAESRAQQMVRAAVEAAGRDNTTALIIEAR